MEIFFSLFQVFLCIDSFLGVCLGLGYFLGEIRDIDHSFNQSALVEFLFFDSCFQQGWEWGWFRHISTVSRRLMLVKCQNILYAGLMKQHGLRHLYKHIGEALKELPFEITSHNRPIARVIPVKKPGFKSTITTRGLLPPKGKEVRFLSGGELKRQFPNGKLERFNPKTEKWEAT